MLKEQRLKALQTTGTRLLPSRPGQLLSSLRSNATQNVTLRTLLEETRIAFQKYGVQTNPKALFAISGLDVDLPHELCVGDECLYEINRHANIQYNLIVREYHQSDEEPVNFQAMTQPQYFIAHRYSENSAHAVGCVYLPEVKTVFVFNNYSSHDDYLVGFALGEYIYESNHFLVNTVSFPEQFQKRQWLTGIDVPKFNLQSVCGFHPENRGLCSQFSQLTPYLMAKEGIFQNLSGTTEEKVLEIIDRAFLVQKKQDRPSISLYNDLKREIFLL